MRKSNATYLTILIAILYVSSCFSCRLKRQTRLFARNSHATVGDEDDDVDNLGSKYVYSIQ